MAEPLRLPALLAASLLVVGAAVKSTAAAQTVAEARIVNGTVVRQPSDKYPYVALPTTDAGSDSWLGCGASIISPTYALTSAHCFGGGRQPCAGPAKLAVWVGDLELGAGQIIKARADGRSFRVEADVECSAKFDGICAHGNDIALLKLKQPVPSWVVPVPLDLVGTAKAGDVVRSFGYGVTESGADPQRLGGVSRDLREVSISILAPDLPSCRRVFAGGYGCSDDASEGPASNLDHQLCAGATNLPERDTCSGDSGSPMVDASGVQVGIVSYGGGPGGKRFGPGRECGDPDFPGIYARVASFAALIQARVSDLPSRAAPRSLALRGGSGGSGDEVPDVTLRLKVGVSVAD